MLDVLTYLFYLLSKPNIPKTDLRCKGTTNNANIQKKFVLFLKLLTYTNLFPHLHLYNVPLGMGHPDSN
jgi:hypothetical protein